MKKLCIGLLLSLSCACAVAAVGCSKNENPKPSQQNTHTVRFEEGKGFEYVSAVKDGDTVTTGTTVSFSLDTSVFYTGSPVVFANGEIVAHDGNGGYNVKIKEDTTITVEGLRKDVSDMAGSGSFDDAFLVTKPIDLLHIAERVNAGDYTYVTGAYVLANDIDCGGEELEVIGDLRTENAYFAGCFTCTNDQATFEEDRPTISNFTINTDDKNYVGLFGAVMADLSVKSSGLFFGIELENFTINASLDNPPDGDNLTVVAGSLVGYGIGATLRNCDAKNGEINVYGDDAYFSFAGGLIGYQQGVLMQEYGQPVNAEISNAQVDVDVNILKGAALYAGGISGYLVTNHPSASAFILNSYATGDVSGAIRTGGVAGGLGQYCSVSNSYATGEVVARATQTVSSVTDDEALEYCTASAGGLVGFAENDTIVNDSFSVSKTYAYAPSGKKYQQTGNIVGGGYEAGYVLASSQKYVVWNCLDENTVNVDDISTIAALNWKDYNWVLKNGSYPTINYESATGETTTVTRHFVTKETDANGEPVTIFVNEESSTVQNYLDATYDPSTYVYAPLGGAFDTGSLPFYYVSDDGKYLSYGYFLDEACTIEMPYAYIPTYHVVLYVAFADPTPVLGEYELLLNNGKNAKLSLSICDDEDSEYYQLGIATYTDGMETRTTSFLYDGKQILIENARLSRYYDGEIVVDTTDSAADAYFDMNRYLFFNYKGELKNDTLQLFDGTYYTEKSPLIAQKNVFRGEYYKNGEQYVFLGNTGVKTSENGEFAFSYTYANNTLSLTFENGDTDTIRDNTLNHYDTFKGSWTKSATVNKTYAFDGMGHWKYTYSAYVVNGYYGAEEEILDRNSGSYTVSSDGTTITFDGITATLNSDGFLQIKDGDKTQLFYKAGSYRGSWTSKADGVTLTLNGIGQDGTGLAIASYENGYDYLLSYENSETDGYVVLYDETDAVFGYFTFNRAYNALVATLLDPNNVETGYTAFTLFVVDDFNGEWISNNATFENITFNGEGLYAGYDYLPMNGAIIVNDEKVHVSYSLINSTLSGQFVYNGQMYTLSYDEDAKAAYIYANGEQIAELERKDRFAGRTFVDFDGNEFIFDGKSGLNAGGSFTFNDKTYGYITDGDSYKVSENGNTVGELKATDRYYALTINGKSYQLYIKNNLMGEWAISGEFATLKVGPDTLENRVIANYKGFAVEMKYYDASTLIFQYTENNHPYTYYVFLIDEETLVVSEYPSLLSGGYKVCTKANELYGVWESSRGNGTTISFDGVSSVYASGVAKVERESGAATLYYYNIKENGIVMWSQEMLNEKTYYYKVVMTEDKDNRNAYVMGDRAFLWIEVDALYLTEAKDADDVTYVFDGGNTDDAHWGTVTASNGKTYSYDVSSYNTDSTANLTLKDNETGATYDAIINYRSSDNITINIIIPDEVV